MTTTRDDGENLVANRRLAHDTALGVGNVLCVKHSMDKMMDIGTFYLQFRHEQNVAQNLKDG